jgi:PAS domain S-box-containing protein
VSRNAGSGAWAAADVASSSVLVEVLGNSPDGVIIGVPDGQILYANRSACNIFRAAKEELCRVGDSGICYRDYPDWQMLLKQRRRTGQSRGVVPMHRLDGTGLLAEVSSVVFQTPNGRVRTCTIVRDVTGRVREERRLVAYQQIAEAVLRKVDRTQVLSLIAHQARTIFDAVDTAVFEARESLDELVIVGHEGPSVSLHPGGSYSVTAPLRDAMAKGRSVLVERMSEAVQVQSNGRVSSGTGMLAPIVSGGEEVATLLVSRSLGTPPFTLDDLEEFTEFTARLGVTMGIGEARTRRERRQSLVNEQLQVALNRRIVIEQAKGFLAAAHNITTEAAFKRLSSYARSKRTGIDQIATQVVGRLLPL